MKRVLSLALALVMAVSLVTFSTVSASAANFTDGDTIAHKEAVDVVSALEIIGGYTDGSFRPDNYLSRGAASKIICNMVLTPTIANQMKGSATDFSDVPADNTYSGYVGWCVSHGIVSGYADGTFKPFDRLSGFAFLKMLLCALGYDQTIEKYTGSGWSSNVQIQALQIGLDSGLGSTLDGSQPVTRDIACLLAFNTLQSDLVEYTGSVAASRRTVTWGSSAPSQAGNINSTTRNGENVTQFAEKYFNTLVKNPQGFGGTDAFARPATSWTLKGNPIGTYHATVSKTYYGDVTLGTLYTDLGLSRSASNVALYLNGVKDNTANVTITSGSSTMLSSASEAAGNAIGAGTELQVFRDSLSNSVTICAITCYAGKISSVSAATASAERYVVISPSTNAGKSPATIGTGTNSRFKTSDFEKDDIVAFTYSDKEGETQRIQNVFPLTTVTGTPSRTVAGTSLEINGTTYVYAKKVAFEGTLGGSEANIKTNNDYTLYVLKQDGTNVVMWAEGAKTAAASTYALLTAFQSATSFNSARARLVFANGTENTVDASRNSDNLPALDDRTDDPIMVRYTVNSDNSYTLKRLSGTEFAASSNAAIRNRTAFGLDGAVDSTAIAADDNTIFVVYDSTNKNFVCYTGIRTVPNVNGDQVRAFTYYQDNVAKVVYLMNGTTSTTSRELMFISAASASPVVSDSSSTKGYRTFNAVLGGRIVKIAVEVDSKMGTLTVTGDNSFKPAGSESVLLNSANFNTNGIYVSGTFTGSAVTETRAQGYTTPSGGYLRVGTRDESGNVVTGTRLALADSVEIYTVAKNGDITETSASRLSGNNDDYVIYTVEEDEITNLFVVKN